MSTPIFASKAAFFSIFQALPENPAENAAESRAVSLYFCSLPTFGHATLVNLVDQTTPPAPAVHSTCPTSLVFHDVFISG